MLLSPASPHKVIFDKRRSARRLITGALVPLSSRKESHESSLGSGGMKRVSAALDLASESFERSNKTRQPLTAQRFEELGGRLRWFAEALTLQAV